MRAFFSPAEIRLLQTLPPEESEVLEALMRDLDARLIEEPNVEQQQQMLFQAAAA